jgi:hypothetical protein
MIGRMSNEWWILEDWKKSVVAYFKVLSHNWVGEAEEIHENRIVDVPANIRTGYLVNTSQMLQPNSPCSAYQPDHE